MYSEEEVAILNAEAHGRNEVINAIKQVLNHWEYLSNETVKQELERIINQYKV